MSWNVNTTCNYRCSYCTQKDMDDRGRLSQDTPRFLRSFARLPGRWEIKLSGGEPLLHPHLTEIAAGLANMGHRISIVTNFSAKPERLLAFVQAAQGRIGVFSCSLHLEYVKDVRAFIDKACLVRQALWDGHDVTLPKPSLNVTLVATRSVLPRLWTLQTQFEQAGLTFKVQPEKVQGGIFAYTSEELAILAAWGGHNRTGEIAHVFTGEPCLSGTRYFILDDRGIAYRCYPARRHKQERLGDFLTDSFALFDGPRPCPYPYCYCTVPIERGFVRKPVISQTTQGTT